MWRKLLSNDEWPARISNDETIGRMLEIEFEALGGFGRELTKRCEFVRDNRDVPSGLTVGQVGVILLPFTFDVRIDRTNMNDECVRAVWAKLGEGRS
jgi:hypothetical protein